MWTLDKPLVEIFPAVYNLTQDKCVLVLENHNMESGMPSWNLRLRRGVHNAEMGDIIRLLACLDIRELHVIKGIRGVGSR